MPCSKVFIAPMSTAVALPSPNADQREWTLSLEGMTCTSHVARVEKALTQESVVTNALMLRRWNGAEP